VVPGGGFSADFRGETLTYSEGDRMVEMEWYWARGYSIVASSIRTWRYRDGRTAPVTPEERALIVERAVRYARDEQGVTMTVQP
jgi:hypothetical protein